MFGQGSIECRLPLRSGSRNAHQIRFVMRGHVRTAVDVQAPFLFAGEARERLTPTLGIAAHEFVEFIAMLEDGAKTRRDDRAGMHRAFQNALMHGRLMRHPGAVGGMPFCGIDIANHECEVSIRNRAAGFAVGNKAASGKFRGDNSEELHRFANGAFQ